MRIIAWTLVAVHRSKNITFLRVELKNVNGLSQVPLGW